MRILNLLLHDERFSGWQLKDKFSQYHFSTQYLRFGKQKEWDPMLYTFHQQVRSKMVYEIDDVGVIKVFPVKFRFPPFLRFGNDHNPRSIMREALRDEPDLVHFHNYYLFSFPYTAFFVKDKLRRPLIAQLHGYNNGFLRRGFYLPSLVALRRADRILYSYLPEESLYRKLKVSERAVRIPIPGVDPEIFSRQRNRRSNHLLYVGRIPSPEKSYGEKSPFLLIQLLRNLVRWVKDVTLDIVGCGPGLNHCRQLAKRFGLEEHVFFHGYIPHSELGKYYQNSVLTFSPISVYDVDGWFDGAIQESLACGTPVAAFKASGKTPLRGTFGFLLSKEMEKAAKEVATLLKMPEEMSQTAEEGSRFVHENCTHEKLMVILQEVWEGVVKA